jgi:hypothetical protein
MSATNFSPILVPAAPMRGIWRGRLAGWLALLAPTRRRTLDIALPAGLGNHVSRDMGLPPGPSHEDRVWGAGGLMWR